MPQYSQPVCIIGAGPAGLACALALAQKGILARIFDLKAGHENRSRATGLKAETMAALDRLGVGGEIRAMATPVYGTRQTYEGKLLRYLPFADKHAETCDNISLNQSDTEAVLIKALEKTAGLRIEWGKAARLNETGLDAQGEILSRPPVVVAADGRYSTLRASAGIATDQTADNEISFGCDAALVNPDQLDHADMHQMFGPEGRVVFVPLPGKGRFKISGTFSKIVTRHAVPDAANMRKLIEARTGIAVGDVEDIFLYRLGSVRARRLVSGPVVLAGDAAQTFYPNGGFGLNTAILQAVDLARVLATGKNLQTYEYHWKKAVDSMFSEMNRLRMSAPL